ncbi:MAG: glycosyltransferase [Planctomycetaceae bacterium]|nr:glycosyltransferase [Planctomycetaceae bacterium]
MRVAFVIERYWPLATAASCVLDALARYLRQQGHEVTILTAQVDHLWPEAIIVRDIPVQRFGLDSWSLFGRKSLGQRVATWLERHPDRWDILVVCESLDGGHYVLEIAEQLSRPSLLSFFESGENSLLGQILTSAGKSREPVLLTNSRHSLRRNSWLTQRNWTVPNFNDAKQVATIQPQADIEAWGLGVSSRAVATDSEKLRVREAICRSRADFERYLRSPLVVYHGHCQAGSDSHWLWQLLSRLCENRAEVCAWVVGDGQAIHGHWRQASEAGLEERIVFPGVFPELGDLFAAADLVLLPQLERHHDYDWLEAISVGTPCLIAQSSGTERLLGLMSPVEYESHDWTTVLPRDLETWLQQVNDYLDQPQKAREQVIAQRSVLMRKYSQQSTLQLYEQRLLGLIREL